MVALVMIGALKYYTPISGGAVVQGVEFTTQFTTSDHYRFHLIGDMSPYNHYQPRPGLSSR